MFITDNKLLLIIQLILLTISHFSTCSKYQILLQSRATRFGADNWITRLRKNMMRVTAHQYILSCFTTDTEFGSPPFRRVPVIFIHDPREDTISRYFTRCPWAIWDATSRHVQSDKKQWGNNGTVSNSVSKVRVISRDAKPFAEWDVEYAAVLVTPGRIRPCTYTCTTHCVKPPSVRAVNNVYFTTSQRIDRAV